MGVRCMLIGIVIYIYVYIDRLKFQVFPMRSVVQITLCFH